MERPKRPVNRLLFAPLIAFLASHTADKVALTFAEIEQIIGWPLSMSAQVLPSYWTSSTFRDGLPARLRAIGWRAQLQVKERMVVFRRVH
jgi:hypothetical protein